MIKPEVGNYITNLVFNVSTNYSLQIVRPKIENVLEYPQYTQEKLHLKPASNDLRLHFYLIFKPGPTLLRKASRLTLRVPSGYITTWMFHQKIVVVEVEDRHLDVSENSGTPKSSILMSFPLQTIHFGVPLFLETPIWNNNFRQKPGNSTRKIGFERLMNLAAMAALHLLFPRFPPSCVKYGARLAENGLQLRNTFPAVEFMAFGPEPAPTVAGDRPNVWMIGVHYLFGSVIPQLFP